MNLGENIFENIILLVFSNLLIKRLQLKRLIDADQLNILQGFT